jgi:hypothetical protein
MAALQLGPGCEGMALAAMCATDVPNALDVRSWIDGRAYEAALQARGARTEAA